MGIFTSFKYKNPDKKARKMKVPMRKNIYGDTMLDVHEKKFHALHYVFKYKYFMPLIKLGKKLCGGALVKKIPEEHYNRNLIAFDKAFERSIENWCLYYLRNSGDLDKRRTRKQMLEIAHDPKNGSTQTLRDMKELVNTMYLYDTAYREFFNILMFEITKEMNNLYKDDKRPGGHLFFTTDIYDPQYYVLEKMVRQEVMWGLSNGEALLKAQEEEQKQREGEENANENKQ